MWSLDGERIVTVAEDRNVRLWHAATGAPHGLLRGHEGAIGSIQWDRAGGQFVTGTSPTDFRSASRGFVLNGNLYALGQATGGATAVTGGYNAVAPRRALANYNAGSGTVTYGVSVRTLPE